MPQGKAPGRLGEISHLFLSGTRARPEPEKGSIEAVIHMAAVGPSLCRAFLASGLSMALARVGTRVTVLETGASLPNVGYYFALEPGEYLALSLGEVKSISGVKGDSIRFSCAAAPGGLSISGVRFPNAAGAHVIMNVFDAAALEAGGSAPAELLEGWRAGSLCSGTGAGTAHAMVIFCEGIWANAAVQLASSFRMYAPFGAVFLPPAGQTGGEAAGVFGGPGIEYFDLPSLRPGGLCRRVPPEDPFFHGLASRALQILGSMSRRGPVDAVL